MGGIMYYFAIFVALSSTFVNPLAQLHQGGTRAREVIEHKADICESHRNDYNGEKPLDNPHDYADKLTDEILRELTLKKDLSGAKDRRESSKPVTEKTGGRHQRPENDKIIDDVVGESMKIHSRQSHVDKNSKVNRKEAKEDEGDSSDTDGPTEFIKNSRMKEKPKFRLFQNVISSPRAQDDPLPSIDSRISRNRNVNINKNVNEISIENEERLKNRDKEEVPARGNENGNEAVVNNSNGTQKDSPLETVEAAITSGSQDSVQDTKEVNPSSTTESLEIVTSSTTPIVDDIEIVKKPRKIHRVKHHGKGHDKRHKKKRHHKQRPPTEQQQNNHLQQPHAPSTESLPDVSTTSTVNDVPQSTESPQSSTTDNSLVEDINTEKNAILTRSILKLLIVNKGEMSSVKTLRLKRLLDQLNADEKETILRDLRQEIAKDTIRVKIVSESKPKFFVGYLAKSSHNDRDDKNLKSLHTPENYEETKNETEDVIDDEKTKKSQKVAAKSSAGVTIDDEAGEKEKDSHSKKVEESKSADLRESNKVASVHRDSKLKGIYEETLDLLRKEAARKDSAVTSHSNEDIAERRYSGEDEDDVLRKTPKGNRSFRHRITSKLPPRDEDSDDNSNVNSNENSNVNSNMNSNVNVNNNRLSAPSRRRLFRPKHPRIPESDVTEEIEKGVPSDEEKKIKSHLRNHGRHSGSPQHLNTKKNSNANSNVNNNRIVSDLQDPDRVSESRRSKHRNDRNPEKTSERPASHNEPELHHWNGNSNMNKNVNVNKIGGQSQSPDENEGDAENSRRSAIRRLPHRSNRNRNVNSNVNVNTIQASAIEDYDEDDEDYLVKSSRRNLDNSISDNVNSNSNSNVNSNVNVNRNVVDRLAHRHVPRRGHHKDEVKLSQKAVDSILREVSDLRKQLAEKEADSHGGSNLDNRRSLNSLHKRHNDLVYEER